MSEKAITIKQPWAYLICSGIKDIENRTWQTKYRGRVYIHTSGSHGKKFNVNLTDEQMIAAFGSISDEAVKGDFQFGAIIGSVEIVDCVINHSSIWAEQTEGIIDSNIKGFIANKSNRIIYNWVLANPVMFDKPITNVKGKLSLWDCSTYLGINQDE